MKNKKIALVVLFAIAMAYLESAVVVYLRYIFGVQEFTRAVLAYDPVISPIELGREIATLIMLFTLGWAVGKTTLARLGYTLIAFGIWDIFYYIWLKVFINWPSSLLDPDLLFLLPLPWWGPVLSPVLIACLMVVWGVLAISRKKLEPKYVFSKADWAGLVLGTLIVLFSFMKDSLTGLPIHAETFVAEQPPTFNWAIYTCGLLLMAYSSLNKLFRRKL